jgi:hypothetical protein
VRNLQENEPEKHGGAEMSMCRILANDMFDAGGSLCFLQSLQNQGIITQNKKLQQFSV